MSIAQTPLLDTVAEQVGEPYLRIVNISKHFGQAKALSEVSLDIYEGEFICFLGPSGCGKTTLLRIIAGLESQNTGQIEQAGQDISTLPPSRRDFGIVFQSYALFPNLTVAKNIAYGLHNRKLKRAAIKQRVTELLALVGLPDKGNQYPAQLSGGQQQRVALARAIATSPGLLLLDEPLSALDAKVRVHLRQEIKNLQRALGITTVMVTHDQEEALSMADRIVVMQDGTIQQVGTPMAIYRQPANVFIADFIGTMNCLQGYKNPQGQIQVGQVSLHCMPNNLPMNQAVTVTIRPEDIVILTTQTDEPNTWVAKVTHMAFLGAYCRATLQSEGLGEAVLQADLSIGLIRQHFIKRGDMVTICLPEAHLQVFAQAA